MNGRGDEPILTAADAGDLLHQGLLHQAEVREAAMLHDELPRAVRLPLELADLAARERVEGRVEVGARQLVTGRGVVDHDLGVLDLTERRVLDEGADGHLGDVRRQGAEVDLAALVGLAQPEAVALVLGDADGTVAGLGVRVVEVDELLRHVVGAEAEGDVAVERPVPREDDGGARNAAEAERLAVAELPETHEGSPSVERRLTVLG